MYIVYNRVILLLLLFIFIAIFDRIIAMSTGLETTRQEKIKSAEANSFLSR